MEKFMKSLKATLLLAAFVMSLVALAPTSADAAAAAGGCVGDDKWCGVTQDGTYLFGKYQTEVDSDG